MLVYNLVLIAGFALTAFATCLLVQRWTGSWIAGLVAGSAFAFNTHTLTRLAHVQGIHIYALPLALLAGDRLLRGQRETYCVQWPGGGIEFHPSHGDWVRLLRGQAAVRAAVSGASAVMVALSRAPGPGYASDTTLVPLESAAEKERRFPRDWIAESGCDVRAEFIDYARPLVGTIEPHAFWM